MDRLSEMQALVAVVDAGSFVKAAESLGLSKAAVSRQVANLEARLGVRLLQRTTRRLSLTEEGRAFVERSRELLASLDEAEAEVTSRSVVAAGRLRVNAPFSFGIRHLAPLWGEFRRRYPQVELDVTLNDRVVDLVDEGFDLAVRIAALPSSTLICRRLAATRIVLCASTGYLKRAGRPRHPEELRKHATIGYSYSASGDEWSFGGPQGRVDVRIQPWMHSNSGETCRAVALAGQGIILQPDFLVGEDLRTGALEELMPEYMADSLGIYVVYPSRKHVSPKVRALIDFLAGHFNVSRDSLPDAG